MSNAELKSSRIDAAERWLSVISVEHEKYRIRREASEKSLVWVSMVALLYVSGSITLKNADFFGLIFNEGVGISVVLLALLVYYGVRTILDARKQKVTSSEVTLCRTVISDLRTEFTSREWKRASSSKSWLDGFLAFYLGVVSAVVAVPLLVFKLSTELEIF